MFETWLWVAAYGILAYVLLTMLYSRISSIYHVDKIGYFMAICDIRKEMRNNVKLRGELKLPQGGSGKSNPFKEQK